MSDQRPTPHALALRAVKVLGNREPETLTYQAQCRLDIARDYLRLERQAYVMAAALLQGVSFPDGADDELRTAVDDNLDVPQDILFDSYPR